ncbi:MAG: right-handed parallel beta-helix repeat-containing protein [Terriglobales bacterium]|jgi:hypothetical protein
MRCRLAFNGLPLAALFLALTPFAMASSTWYVNGVSGNDDNNCMSPQTACKTIGHAISLASSGDSIMIAAAIYKETLTISFSLKLIGASASTTIIDGGGYGNVVYVPSTVHVGLSNVTIRNGAANGGAGIASFGVVTINNSTITKNIAEQGGGIDNAGEMTLNDSTVSGNTVPYAYDAWGGAIYNSGALTLNGCTLTDNSVSANYSFGAGIYSTGTLTIVNSTISGNSAEGESFSGGGGIANGGTLTISNSTITGNGATAGDVQGGGIYGAATLQNSIVANNLKGGNCSGTITSQGYNLSSDKSCHLRGTGDLNDIHPKLGPLQNNGGPTKTRAELLGSPTIDAGNPSGCTDSHGHLLKTDQRGDPRPGKYKHDKRCDMGAFERQTD